MKVLGWIRKLDDTFYQWLEKKRESGLFLCKTLCSFLIHMSRLSPAMMLLVLFSISLVGWMESKGGRIVWLFPVSVLAGGISRALCGLLGYAYPRIRPFAVYGNLPLIDHAPSFSFPSKHAAGGFALAVVLCGFQPMAGWFFLIWACILAFSRVFVRLHYLSDVVAGAALGGCSGSVALQLFFLFQRL
jgi:undecaprenyl-diphosphatase